MKPTLGTAGPTEGERTVNTRLPRRPLRRRVTSAILLVTGAALVVFAVPLAYAVRESSRNQALSALERDAVRVAALVPDTPAEAVRNLPARPPGLSDDVHFGVYDARGNLLGGDGPLVSTVAAAAADGRPHGAIGHGYSASAPVPSDGLVSVTVLTTTTGEDVNRRNAKAWWLMALLAAAVLVGAGLVARQQARRLSRPLENLTRSARALGQGDFTIRAIQSGIAEVDEAAEALVLTAARLGQVEERERSFVRDVSHQLRTPLAGLLLGIENALERDGADDRGALTRALEGGRRLETTIDDLLELTRHGVTPTTELRQVLHEIGERWRGALADQGRRMVVRLPAATRVSAPPAAVRQILDVLVGNALRHGQGTVVVATEEIASGIAVGVSDEGDAMTGAGAATGLGLELARSLANASGALLQVPPAGAPPLFRLLIPLADPSHSPAS